MNINSENNKNNDEEYRLILQEEDIQVDLYNSESKNILTTTN